jgi:hypothetical protein
VYRAWCERSGVSRSEPCSMLGTRAMRGWSVACAALLSTSKFVERPEKGDVVNRCLSGRKAAYVAK